jgi:hypothetical protein
MRRQQRGAALLLLAVLTLIPATSSASDARWIDAAIPIDAVAIGRIDLHRVLATPLGAALLDELTENIEGVNWFLGAAFGFDLDQVDYVWLVVGPDEGGLALLQGRYDADVVARKIRRMPRWRSVRYQGIRQVSAYKNDQGQPQLAAVLRDDLLAMGDRPEMEKMLDVWLGRSESLDPAREGVQLVIGSTAELSLAALDASRLTLASEPGTQLIERAWLEGRLDDDLHFSLQTEVVDQQAAIGLEQMVQGLILILERHPDVQADPMLLAALDNAAAERRGRELALTTRIPGTLILAARARRTEAAATEAGAGPN